MTVAIFQNMSHKLYNFLYGKDSLIYKRSKDYIINELNQKFGADKNALIEKIIKNKAEDVAEALLNDDNLYINIFKHIIENSYKIPWVDHEILAHLEAMWLFHKFFIHEFSDLPPADFLLKIEHISLLLILNVFF